MNIHIDADGGLVSNPSDREIQGTSALAAAAAPVSNVSTSSWCERHIAKRDIGHLSNRKLIDPSASESRIPAHLAISTGREWRNGISVCLFPQKRYMNPCVGIVLGGPLQIGLTSCRDGNKGMCSPLGQGHLKSESLFRTNSQLIVSRVDDCSGMEDNGLWGVLMGMEARDAFVFDHNESVASSLIEGTIACRQAVYPVHSAIFPHWSQSLLCTCTQGRGAESMGGAPDIGGPSDGEDLQTQPIGDSVSGSYSVSSESTKTDHVNNLPMLILKSSLSSHAVRQAFPIWFLVEISHPRAQF